MLKCEFYFKCNKEKLNIVFVTSIISRLLLLNFQGESDGDDDDDMDDDALSDWNLSELFVIK